MYGRRHDLAIEHHHRLRHGLKNFVFADTNNKPVATGTVVGSLPTGNMIVDAGMLRRDGTVVHIPFLTTAAGYEHALVMVNRNPRDAKYTVTFVDESGGTSTAGDMAQGMLMKEAITNIPSSDLVTIEGRDSTRPP